MAKITKTDLITRAFEHDTFETKTAAGEVVQIVLDTIQEALLDGEEVYLGQNIGALKPVTRAPRTANHPQNHTKISVPERKTVKFSISKAFKSQLND